MPYRSGAVATELRSGLTSYKMPVSTSSRYSGSSSASSSYRSSLDRPYYSSSTGSYSSSTSSALRSTLPRSPLTSEYRLSYSTNSSLSSRRTSEDPSPLKPRSTPPPPSPAPSSRRSTIEQDMYSKYSPSNYVPNSDRTSTNATSSLKTDDKASSVRSRSTKNAVVEVSYGRVPQAVGGCSTSTLERRVRQVSIDEVRSTASRDNNNTTTNPANTDATSIASLPPSTEVKEDDNGNGRRLSVAEIRRRFDATPSPPPPPPPLPPTLNGCSPSPAALTRKTFVVTSAKEASSSSSSEEEDSDDSDDKKEAGRGLRRTVPTSNMANGAGAGASPKAGGRYARGGWTTQGEESDPDTSTNSARHTKKANGLTGLVNIGNTCFMNSVVQCLSNTKPLVEYLLSDSYMSELNNSSGMKGKLISAFSEMVRELWSSSGSVASPVAFKAQISKYAPRFTGYSQQDAQEFLRFLLEGVHEDVNRIKTKPRQMSDSPETNSSPDQKAVEQWKRYLRQDDSKIVDLFVGQLRSTLRCSVCGHCSVTFDPFWDLQLPIPSRTGQLRLQQCLDHFTTEEVLDGNEKAFCAQCEKNQKSTKSFTIQKFPKILVLQLNRFSPTDRYRRKLSVTVDFPLDHLDLSAYAAVRGNSNATYNLYGVSNHSGSPSFGHYTAYCKHPHTGEWHEYNDSRVSSISSRSVVSSEAYLLFYELSGRTSHL